jgi:hypothetical protein
MRLRRTALPTMRAAIANPRRGTGAPVLRANIANKASAERRASRYTRSNSDFCRRRCAGLNGRAGDEPTKQTSACVRAARIARSCSDSETLATLRAAPCENLTTRSGSHAGAKAVSALTVQIARLVCTLHAGSRPKNGLQKCAKTSTCRAQKKGGKGTQRLPQCQARGRAASSERSRARAVDNPASIDIDSPSFRVARAEQILWLWLER